MRREKFGLRWMWNNQESLLII